MGNLHRLEIGLPEPLRHQASACAFGSRAEEVAAQVAVKAIETAHPFSDVDIGVLPVPGRHLTADSRTPAAAESYLWRGLKALLDLGRHIRAKGLNCPVTEYREVAWELGKAGVLGPAEAALLARMAGYQSRLVHFYHQGLADIERVLEAMKRWLRAHPECLDLPCDTKFSGDSQRLTDFRKEWGLKTKCLL